MPSAPRDRIQSKTFRSLDQYIQYHRFYIIIKLGPTDGERTVLILHKQSLVHFCKPSFYSLGVPSFLRLSPFSSHQKPPIITYYIGTLFYSEALVHKTCSCPYAYLCIKYLPISSLSMTWIRHFPQRTTNAARG